MKTSVEHKKAVKTFIETWQGRGYEKGESQAFWLSLLRDILEEAQPEKIISFEEQVKLDHTSFIDGYIECTKVLIEQKSLNIDLHKPIKQSNGALLTPFRQAQNYIAGLPVSKHPRWIVTCNFKEFLIYDMENPNSEPESVLLEDLEKDWYRLKFLVDTKSEHIQKEQELSLRAGILVGKLYNALRAQYDDESIETLRNLNILCVRLVFCMYAEDAEVFGSRDQFVDYLRSFSLENVREGIEKLFEILNTPMENRTSYMNPKLKAFPYVNGGLFGEKIVIPRFTENIIKIITEDCCANFDWSDISPTIFGAVFESTLNPETRRNGGMHYTSLENIHKVIDPLFLDDLRTELDEISIIPIKKNRDSKLKQYQEKLAGLIFLDPACGSGNFLTETFISLRRLENRVLAMLLEDEKGKGSRIGFTEWNPVKVNISQFYGIEINDFAVTVAKTAIWISEIQMMEETERLIGRVYDIFPLKTNVNIIEGNALSIDWEQVISKEKLTFIIGNPPFIGARNMDGVQKENLVSVFGEKWKNVGNLDFVCAWFKKSADYMERTKICAALVSTNSVCQGENVSNLWKPLFLNGLQINFAHRTFQWNSESNQKAHVHCVIVGFSYYEKNPKTIFTDNRPLHVKHINAYLIDAIDVFVESRSTPLCDVPKIGIGNKPIDNGNYLFSAEEKVAFIKLEPASAQYFKPFYGAEEFINRKPRYCLWLGDCSPAVLRSMPHCMERVQNVRQYRLASKSEGTRKLADKPTRFHVENMPNENYLLIPRTSSERRRYVPIGFMKKESLSSDSVHIINKATFYHFGVLTSNVHMAWMRLVCGRLKSDYRYSKDIVYNNFPWPTPTKEQKEKIEATAQNILDARALYPNNSLADLYDETTMPIELRRAHQENDRTVMQAYGFKIGMKESECVTELLKMYQELTERK